MKKWEEQQRLKAHHSKIKNAKPQVSSVAPSSNPKSSSKIKSQRKLNDSMSSQRSGLSGLTSLEKEDKNSIPLYRLLKLHNLQQYAQALITRGFGYDLTKFGNLVPRELEGVCEEIKILPGHKIKFIKLVEFIQQMIPQNEFLAPSAKKQKPQTKTHTAAFKKKQQQQQQPRQQQQSTSMMRVRNIGMDFFQDEMDNEFNEALEDILKKYQTQQEAFFKQPLEVQPKPAVVQTEQKVIPKKRMASKAQDDIELIPKFKNDRMETQVIQNRLVQRLEKQSKTRKKKVWDEDENEPRLEYSQVKLMYQSFDSGHLTSTLINLDIEEMCNCLGYGILKHLNFVAKRSQVYGVSQLTKKNGDCSQNPIEEPTYLQYDDQHTKLFQSQTNEDEYLGVMPQKNTLGAISEKTFDQSKQIKQSDIPHQPTHSEFEQSRQQIENILKESMLYKQQHEYEEEQFDDEFYEQVDSEEESPIKGKIQYSLPKEQRQQKMHEISQDSLQYEEQFNYSQSQMDLSFESKFEAVDSEQGDMKRQFARVFNDESSKDIPNQEVISNYCKNIIITSKMEKEATIVCLIYLERLLIKSGLGLEPQNWRKITFIGLVIANKIWDDESFENDNFAQAFPQYSTKQINEMERVFLQCIDYSLYIHQGDYAKYYFLLRTYVEAKKKSFPLRPLNLNTIITLQRNSNKAEVRLREAYQNPMNRSF